jgi:hypothetical protein
VVCAHCEVFAHNLTFAPSTGRCCGSWINPVIEPKMVALAVTESSSNPPSSASVRDMFSP